MHGMLKMDEKHKIDGKRCVWLQRNIADLEEQEPSYQVSRFTGNVINSISNCNEIILILL
jgi:hypothetical protein